ncbi:GNA1162 family protein [Rheinheimera sp.]|uniref:GNA1162 family protein n=1 Tax=Rheinheimera sp. TaxID=1869214 RepID=UPI00307EC54C
MKSVCIALAMLLSGCALSPEQQLFQQRLTEEYPTTLRLVVDADSGIPPELVSAGYSILPAQLEKELGVTVLEQDDPQDADATMTVHINKWHRDSSIVYQSGTVAAEYRLVSLKSGQLLWQHQEQIANWNLLTGLSLIEEAAFAMLNEAQNEPARMLYYLNKDALADFPASRPAAAH